jgi:CheY-like chemotaxis protein
LLEAQKMEGIGRLAGGVAHDFNNILSGILGYASLMSTKLEPGSEFRRYVHVIEESASRAAELTKQLLAFAREEGASRMQVDLNRIVDESLKLVSAGLDPNIQLDFHPGEGVNPVHADPGQLQQLVTNLCINSRDALAGTGAISVRTSNAEIDEAAARRLNLEATGPYVQLTVSDDGCGMPPEVTQRMFEPFFSTKQDGQAYGLGLSVVYGIVSRQKGAIHVESEHKQGTEIHIYIPAASDASAATGKIEAPSAEPAQGSETILVVDDEELVRAVVGDILKTAGYTVLEASTGEEAIDLYQRRQGAIGLIVLDLIMPGMGGIRALEELRKIDPEVRCILNSGHTAQTIDTRELTGKHVRFMPKPFQAGVLTTAVRDVLDA